jgi:hypothetical protein
VEVVGKNNNKKKLIDISTRGADYLLKKSKRHEFFMPSVIYFEP